MKERTMRAGIQDRAAWMVVATLVGATAALALFPRARTVVTAQIAVALGQRPEWLRAVYGGPAPRLERTLAAAPDDVELHAGAATLQAGRGEDRAAGPRTQAIPGSTIAATKVKRLQALAARFPENASVHAHILRYLTLGAVQIPQVELSTLQSQLFRGGDPTTSRYPPPEAMRVLEAAARAGRRLEPENGYFDAMLAVGAFAAERDEEALRHLHAAAARTRWEDHTTEETRAQWKLMAATYGDRGSLQKIPGTWGLLFPHMAQLRAAANLAVWHATRREHAGDTAAVRVIRGDVMRLGLHMESGSAFLISRLVGRALFQIGTRQDPPGLPRGARPPYRNPGLDVWQKRRERYAAWLERQGAADEAAWVRAEGQRMDEQLVEPRAWDMDVVPSRLAQLEVWWGIGIVFLRQIALLLALGAAAAVLARVRRGSAARRGGGVWVPWLVIGALLIVIPLALVAATGGLKLLSFSFFFGLGMAGVLALAVISGRREPGPDAGRSERRPRWRPGLVALVCFLPTTLLLLAASQLPWQIIGSGAGLYPFTEENVMHWWSLPNFDWTAWVPYGVALPALMLVFLVLCRVAALGLPLPSGFGRGMLRTLPWAVALLVTVYVATVPLTVAADRGMEALVVQSLDDEMRALDGTARRGS